MKKLNNCYLAVIPARGGSKRIPKKNLADLGRKPLISYTIEASINSSRITRTIVSTDSQEITDCSLKYGAEMPFVRPSNLAKDNSSIISVLYHAFKKLDSKKNLVKAVILLQPTSPFRDSKNIDEAIDLFEKTGADTVTAVCYPDESPYYAWKIRNNKLVPLFSLKYQNKPRSKLPATLMENGSIFIIRRETIINKKIYGEKIVPYIMNREASLDIDDPEDLLFAEYLMAKKKKSK